MRPFSRWRRRPGRDVSYRRVMDPTAPSTPDPSQEPTAQTVLESDDKDWTWVLERPCPECGFDAGTLTPEATGAAIRSLVPIWQDVLARADVAGRRRVDRWSDLEYGCHVRDVFRLFDHRLSRMLEESSPQFANWDQDVTAAEDRYHEQDAARVAAELAAAAEILAARFDDLGPADAPVWARDGHRSDGAHFTVASFARYLLHDPLHHVWDVALPAPRSS